MPPTDADISTVEELKKHLLWLKYGKTRNHSIKTYKFAGDFKEWLELTFGLQDKFKYLPLKRKKKTRLFELVPIGMFIDVSSMILELFW